MADPVPFAHLKIVELSSDPAGEMLGKYFAGMGAGVAKLEPEGGAASRAVGPYRSGAEGPNDSLNFWFYNANKRSVTADLGTASGKDRLGRLMADADIVISGFQPRELRSLGLDWDAVASAHPRLIIVSVTPFGLTGPWADRRSSELVALALGGPLHMCGYDDHGIPPILPGGNQAYNTAAIFAYKAALLVLIDREQTGSGQLVDISMHEACAVTVELGNPYWFYSRAIVQRQTCRHAQPVMTQPAIFECADGRYVFLALMLSEQKPWQALVEWIDSHGMAGHLTEPEFSEYAYRQARYSEVQAIVECFFLVIDADTAFQEGQGRGLPVGMINSPEELLSDPHLNARDFFVEVDHGAAGTFRYPGPPYQFSAFSAAPAGRAPMLGEHDDKA
ncbi:MAG TPA: CoA transferase [Stellaceae bacterium]|nr:CoA transferase [Stellaceae bacterium]